MSRHEFPALGFDPAPGDANALDSAASRVSVAARTFGTAATQVATLTAAGWTGEAGDAFRRTVGPLPHDLDWATRSHQSAASALAGYGAGLAARQRRARDLETQAAELRSRQAAAIGEVNRLAALRAPDGSAELADLRSRYSTARSRAESAGAELDRVLAQARHLRGQHHAAASAAARAIRAAADTPYRKPNALSRALGAAKRWITDHADVLATISTVLKGVSAALGVLSLVPGLQFLAPFAMLAGGLALAVDVAVKLATGRGSWKALALDTALMVMPWGRVAVAVRKTSSLWRPGSAAVRRASGTASRPAANAAQAARLRRHYDYADRYGTACFRELADGRIRYYEHVHLSRTPGEMAGRRLVKEWNPISGRDRTWHETVDHTGRVRQVRVENGAPKIHHRFDKDGGYTGAW